MTHWTVNTPAGQVVLRAGNALAALGMSIEQLGLGPVRRLALESQPGGTLRALDISTGYAFEVQPAEG